MDGLGIIEIMSEWIEDIPYSYDLNRQLQIFEEVLLLHSLMEIGVFYDGDGFYKLRFYMPRVEISVDADVSYEKGAWVINEIQLIGSDDVVEYSLEDFT